MSSDCVAGYSHADFSYYRYAPSMALASAFAAAFGVFTFVHICQMCKGRTWYLGALVVGGICECVGYIGRVLSAADRAGCWSLGPYMVQTILILIGPAFMAASIYMILGRIILLIDGERHALIRRKYLTKIFVAGDVIALLLQACGGGQVGMQEVDAINRGKYMIVAGIVTQLVFFGFFVVVCSTFHYRMRSSPTPAARRKEIRWNAYLLTLYATSSAILVRCVFRLVEYLQGNSGYLVSREAYLYIFDGALMLGVLMWMSWFHPSEIGVLLRGGDPARNGFVLLGGGGRDPKDAEHV